MCSTRTIELRQDLAGLFTIALTADQYSDESFAAVDDSGRCLDPSSELLAYLLERDAAGGVLERFDNDEAAGAVTLSFASDAELILKRP